jgi:hypothetical protein
MSKLNFNFGKNILFPFVVLLAGLVASTATAIEHEGFLIGPTGLPINGNVDITFTLYEGNDSAIVWVEKQSFALR